MVKIISTVGASLYSNYVENGNCGQNIINTYEKYRNDKDSSCADKQKNEDLRDLKKELLKNIGNELMEISAETKSIELIKKKLGDKTDFTYVFICPDSCIAKICAECICEKLGIEENDRVIECVDDLQINNANAFVRNGLHNLFNKIENIAGAYPNMQSRNVVLNITGGYKAIVPFLSMYAQINNIPLYYVFEDSNDLIEMPQLPIATDTKLYEENQDLLVEIYHSYGEMQRQNVEQKTLDEISGITINDDNDGIIMLNAFGVMYVKKCMDELVRLYVDKDKVKAFREPAIRDEIKNIARKFVKMDMRKELTGEYLNEKALSGNKLIHFVPCREQYVYITKIQNKSSVSMRILCRYKSGYPYIFYAMDVEKINSNANHGEYRVNLENSYSENKNRYVKDGMWNDEAFERIESINVNE